MAGHNKWSKIKHRKAVVDKRRAKAWTMCSRAIITAARLNGPDPNFNFALRQAIDEARYHNVPNDNIERAIKKGVGGGAGDDYQPVRYEGYGPGGVAVIVDALTNNRARTAGDIRLIFGDHEGRLGTSGCVAHQFEQKGRVRVLAPADAEARVFDAAASVGADDVEGCEGEEGFDVLCAAGDLGQVLKGLGAAGLKVGESGIEMRPLQTVRVDADAARSLLAFIEALEDNEDVKRVYSNADIPEDVLAVLEG